MQMKSAGDIARKLALAILSVFALAASTAAFAADQKPDATVVIDEKEVMFLVGGGEGHGVLVAGEDSYGFKTKAVIVGAIGFEKIHLVGDVYNLKNVKDFAGDYSAAKAGVALVKGVDGYWMSNPKGVIIRFKGKSKGAALSLGLSGMKITLD